MDLICPECRSPLRMTAANIAACESHGKSYEVLFDRYAGDSPEARVRSSAPAADCADHPGVPAVTSCRLCGKAVCGTCDFALPGGVHLCPACIENSESRTEVSPKRKRLSYIGIALAAWSTALLVLMFAGAFNSLLADPDTTEAADLIITNLALWPLLIGTGVSMGAIDRRLKSTMTMKVAVWWNGVLAALFLLFVFAANFGVFG